MPTTFVNTIDDIVILAKRSQCDYAGNDIQTTYATKSELPTATSDLTNDSDFITSSDIPVKDVQVGGTSVVNAQGIAEISIPQTGVLDVEVDGSSVVNAQGVAEITLPAFTQVNADWDATSGVSEILNKPDLSIYAESSDLATVATSGSYNDLLDKPSIPSAQVNADWDATSGVSAILNKPNLATVATTGDYSDLQNLPSIPAAQVNSDWTATSGVAQILNKPSIPTATSDLTNDSNFITLSDVPAQVNADWNATSGVAEILNKPTIPSYTAGNGIDITSNVVSAKVDGTTINTNASGELTVIGGGGGTQADWTESNPTDPSYIENKPTPKTLSAGTGISISEGVSTITISSNASVTVDETVLWEDANGATNNITLSEAIENFDSVKVEWCPYTEASNWTVPYDVVETKVSNGLLHLVGCGMSNDTNYQVMTNLLLSCSTTSVTLSKQSAILTTTSASSVQSLSGYKIFKIIGVNRIASN